ncbi:MAG: tetratricopeptide repeat protein [Bacteriovoracaceae bacterium]
MEISAHREMMVSARACFDKGEYKKALMIFNEIIEVDNKNTEAYFCLANIFHIHGEIGKAIKAFSKVLELDPNHTDASISLSVLLNDIGKYEEAKKVFEKANSHVKNVQSGIEDPHINKKFSLKHYELAEQYFAYNRFDEALFEYNKAVSLDPDHLELRVKMAKVYSKKGFNSKAFDELKKLKNEYPGYLPARLALGLLYYGNGNVVEAQTEWQAILSKDPTHSEAKMYVELSKSATETQFSLN